MTFTIGHSLNIGKKCSKRTKQKIGDANRNRVHTLMSCKNMSDGRIKYEIRKSSKLLQVFNENKNLAELEQIMTGIILSDGYLHKTKNKQRNSNLRIEQKLSSKQFLTKIKKVLADFNLKSNLSLVTHKENKKWNMKCRTAYFLESQSHPYFTELRKKWYDDKGKKIIPNDLLLTPKTLAFGYMGDGYSTRYTNGRNVTVQLCTDSFSYDEVLSLKKKLQNIGIETTIQKSSIGDPRIAINKSEHIIKFMDMINPHIINCFNYKIKYPNIKNMRMAN